MSTTKLHLEFPDFDERYFDYLEINSQIVEIKEKSKDIVMKKSINREHINEEIKLFNKEDYVKYKIDLYQQTDNNFYCLLSSKNNCAFQIYDYGKENPLESINIIQKNTIYNLTLYDKTGLKCCKRFNIINCSKDCLDKNIFDIQKYVNDGSYVINRFHKKNSVEKMKEPIYHEIDFKSLSEEDKNYLIKLETDFNKIYDPLANDDTIDNMEKNNKLRNELVKIVKGKHEFTGLSNLHKILAGRRKLEYNEDEYNICYGYVFLLLLKTFKGSLLPYTLYTMFLYYLNDLKQKIPNSYDLLRMMLWYNGNYLKNRDFIENIECKFENDLNPKDGKLVEELHRFSLVCPNSCNKNTPYKNCYDFLYEFIEELNEDSYLLEILYLLDSDTASNRMFKNVRTFQLSLLSLSQIKEHLKLIIPDVVVRKFHSEFDRCNADYDPAYGILECFEGTLYDKDIDSLNSILIKNEDTLYQYSLPLIMVFFHELFGHAKHRLDNSHSKSPTHFYDPYAEYELLYHCYNGESGRIFEYYISDDIEIIKYLKFALFPNADLMDIKLWTASDLSKLRQIVKQKINANKFFCNKKIKDFPDISNNIEPIPAKGGYKDEFLSDDDVKDMYISDENYVEYPHDYPFPKNTKIYCM